MGNSRSKFDFINISQFESVNKGVQQLMAIFTKLKRKSLAVHKICQFYHDTKFSYLIISHFERKDPMFLSPEYTLTSRKLDNINLRFLD